MKVTNKQLQNFAYSLPQNVDYDSPSYGRISVDPSDLMDYLADFLRQIDPSLEITEE